MKFDPGIRYVLVYLGVFSILTSVYSLFFTDLHLGGYRYDLSALNQIISPIGSTFFYIINLSFSLFSNNVIIRSNVEDIATLSVGIISAVSVLGLIKKQCWARSLVIVFMSMQSVFDVLLAILTKNALYLIFSVLPGIAIYCLLRSNVKEQFENKNNNDITRKQNVLFLLYVVGFNTLIILASYVLYNYVSDVQFLYGDMQEPRQGQITNINNVQSSFAKNILGYITNFDTNHCVITDEGHHSCQSIQIIKTYQMEKLAHDLPLQAAFTENSWGFYTGTQYHMSFEQGGIYYYVFMVTPDFWSYVVTGMIISVAGTSLMLIKRKMIIR